MMRKSIRMRGNEMNDKAGLRFECMKWIANRWSNTNPNCRVTLCQVTYQNLKWYSCEQEKGNQKIIRKNYACEIRSFASVLKTKKKINWYWEWEWETMSVEQKLLKVNLNKYQNYSIHCFGIKADLISHCSPLVRSSPDTTPLYAYTRTSARRMKKKSIIAFAVNIDNIVHCLSLLLNCYISQIIICSCV